MLRFSFFKTRKPKQFEFTARYYDPQKESFERRRRMIRMDLGKEVGRPSREDITFRQSHTGYRGDAYYNRLSRMAALRMIAVFFGSVLVCWYLLERLGVMEHIFGR